MDVSPRLRAGLCALGALDWPWRCSHTRLTSAFGLGSAELDEFFQDWVYCGADRRPPGPLCVTARGGGAGGAGAPGSSWASGSWPGRAATSRGRCSSPTTRTRRTRPCPTCSTWPSIRRATPRCSCWRARARTPSAAASGSTARSPALTVAALIATLAFQPIVDATSGEPGRDRGEPRLSGRRPAAAGPRRRGLRPERLAAGPGLAPPGRRPRAERGGGRHLPRADRQGHLRRGHAPRPRLARVGVPGRAGRLAAPREEDRAPRLGDHGRAGRLRGRGRPAARVRPLRARERRRR